MKDTHHITCPGFLPKRVKNQWGASLLCPSVPCPRPLLSLSGGLVGGKWRSQTSSLAVQRGSNAYCPGNSLSIRNCSHLTVPSQCGVQTCWKGVRKNLLGALEAPVLQAAAVPVIPEVCLQCLPGRHSVPVKGQVQNLTNQC